MPAKSKAQQRAAGAALAAKRGEVPPGKLYGAAKSMYKDMSSEQISHFSGTPRKGLPAKACMISMEASAAEIVNRLLAEDCGGDDEVAEVGSARSILAALQRLQSSLPDPTPEQQHDITTIRASANALIRMHQ